MAAEYFKKTPAYHTMADDWVEERDKAVLNTIYYCETCNIIIELGDADISIHKKDLPHHKMRQGHDPSLQPLRKRSYRLLRTVQSREEPVLVQELHLRGRH